MTIPNPTGEDDILDITQRLVDSVNAQQAGGVFAGGVLKELSLTTADQEVYHGLGRVPTVCMAVKQSAAGTALVVVQHGDPRNYINVRGTGSFTATVLIA